MAGVQQCLRERGPGGLRPMLVATCAAGLGLLSLALLRPAGVVLPAQLPLAPGLLAGGALLGAGALLNGACYLGSVQYLGRGNPNFLLTMLGLGLAARSAAGGTPMAMRMVAGSAGRMPDASVAIAGLALFAVLLSLPMRGARSAAVYAAAAAGLVAAGIYAWHPAWSYGVVVESLVHARHGMAPGLLAACLLFVGATLGAVLQHRWQLAPLEPLRAARCLAGGFVMGWGAHLVPGGNDMLLLWVLPGLAAYGLVAYIAMLATLALLMVVPQAMAAARR